tara:strand:- start:252 stop:419 length:168 start_codon:yes stop_codon:yes gene_type:complete
MSKPSRTGTLIISTVRPFFSGLCQYRESDLDFLGPNSQSLMQNVMDNNCGKREIC